MNIWTRYTVFALRSFDLEYVDFDYTTPRPVNNSESFIRGSKLYLDWPGVNLAVI